MSASLTENVSMRQKSERKAKYIGVFRCLSEIICIFAMSSFTLSIFGMENWAGHYIMENLTKNYANEQINYIIRTHRKKR